MLVAMLVAIMVIDHVALFYVLFEGLLYLMYVYLVSAMLTSRAHHSMLALVVYTVVGSALLLIALIMVYTTTGSTGYAPVLGRPPTLHSPFPVALLVPMASM